MHGNEGSLVEGLLYYYDRVELLLVLLTFFCVVLASKSRSCSCLRGWSSCNRSGE